LPRHSAEQHSAEPSRVTLIIAIFYIVRLIRATPN
jgi:hypothetical protein